MRRAVFLCALGLLSSCAPPPLQEYPARVVTIVVPFTPGGSNDLIARFLADGLSKTWNQTVVVENRPGGGSSTGAAHVAKSAADGYKLLLGSSSYTTNAATVPDQPFDPVKDLTAVSMVARNQVAIVVAPRLPVTTLADLVREAKARPVFYGSSGIGSNQHFNAEMLNEALGIKMTPVPYPGGTGALTDLAAGRIDVVVGALAGLLPSIRNGLAKPIAILSKTRSQALPDVSTTVEAGYPAATTLNYWAIFVPAGVPEAIVTKITEGIATVTHSTEGRSFLAKLDAEPAELSAAEVASYVAEEISLWTGIAKRLNIAVK